jgi:hypothetical protein
MKQTIDMQIWDSFYEELTKAKRQVKNKIQNSGRASLDNWTGKITAKVKISELADEFGITACPNHKNDYPIIFDDSRGWFICVKAKYEGSCNFKGNIVNFMERFG